MTIYYQSVVPYVWIDDIDHKCIDQTNAPTLCDRFFNKLQSITNDDIFMGDEKIFRIFAEHTLLLVRMTKYKISCLYYHITKSKKGQAINLYKNYCFSYDKPIQDCYKNHNSLCESTMTIYGVSKCTVSWYKKHNNWRKFVKFDKPM